MQASETNLLVWQEAAIELSSYVRQAGLDGIWEVPPVYDGQALRSVLPSLPFGPAFREVRGEAQSDTWLCLAGHVQNSNGWNATIRDGPSQASQADAECLGTYDPPSFDQSRI